MNGANNLELQQSEAASKIDKNDALEIPSHTIDEAMELAGNGLFQYIILVVAGIATSVVVIENHTMGYVIPTAKCDLNVSVGQQGFINAIGFIGFFVSAHFWGFITDTWGHQKTLRLTLSLSFLSSAISSFSITSLMLIITRFIVGICSAGVHISAISYCSEFFSTANRSKYLALLISFTSAGIAIQPLLGMVIMTLDFEIELFPFFVYKPWRLFTLIGGAIAGLVAFSLIFLPEGPKHTLAMGKQAESLEIMKTMYRVNTKFPRESYIVQKLTPSKSTGQSLVDVHSAKGAIKLVWNQTWPLFVEPLVAKTVVLCTLMFVAFAVSQGMHVWNPQILIYYEDYMEDKCTICEAVAFGYANTLRNTTLASDAELTVNSVSALPQQCDAATNPFTFNVLFVMGTTFVTLSTIVGFLVKRFGRTVLLTAWILINGLSAFGIIWVTNFYVNIMFVILMASTISMMNMHISTSSDVFPNQFKGMAVSLMLMSGRFGTFVGSNIISAMLYTYCDILYGVSSILLLSCTIVTYYTLRTAEQDKLEG